MGIKEVTYFQKSCLVSIEHGYGGETMSQMKYLIYNYNDDCGNINHKRHVHQLTNFIFEDLT